MINYTLNLDMLNLAPNMQFLQPNLVNFHKMYIVHPKTLKRKTLSNCSVPHSNMLPLIGKRDPQL